MYFAAVPTYWKPSAARSLPEFLNVESRCPNFRAATNSSESGLEWRPLPPAPKRPVAAARYPKGACRHRWGGGGGGAVGRRRPHGGGGGGGWGGGGGVAACLSGRTAQSE